MNGQGARGDCGFPHPKVVSGQRVCKARIPLGQVVPLGGMEKLFQVLNTSNHQGSGLAKPSQVFRTETQLFHFVRCKRYVTDMTVQRGVVKPILRP